MTRLLGEEATRILQTARESGNQIKSRAEESAARLLREATEEAQRQREEADREARRRSDAVADAEAELTMAKQQGREMVERRRANRERVLGELARRRVLARQQIEQLVHGRDRLLEALERAGMVAIDVVAEIFPLGSPEEYADFEPPGGPLPLVSPAEDSSATEETTAPVELVDTGTPEALPPAAEEPSTPDDAQEPTAPARDTTVVPFPTAEVVDNTEPQAASEDGEVATGVADVADVADVPETPFQRRDATLVPLIVAGARKLKRVLADEQNEVLDTLRSKEPVRTLDALVPAAAGEQSERYVDAIASELTLAAEAGSLSVGAAVALDIGPTGTLAPAREALASGLVGAVPRAARALQSRTAPATTETRSPTRRAACLPRAGRHSASTSSSTTSLRTGLRARRRGR